MKTAVKSFLGQSKIRNGDAESINIEKIYKVNNISFEEEQRKMRQKLMGIKKDAAILKALNTDNWAEGFCQLCEDLSRHLVLQGLSTAEPRKEGDLTESISGIYLCSATLALIDNNVIPKLSMPVLLKCFGVSEFSVWQIVKILLADPRNKVLIENLGNISIFIVQTGLWGTESSLWTELPIYDNQIPSYEQLKNVKEQLQQNFVKGGDEVTEKVKADGNAVTKDEQWCIEKSVDKNIVPSTSFSKTSPKWKSSFLSTINGIYNYAFSRFKELCTILCVSTCLQDMWTSFNHALTCHCEEIFRGRHLDQLILCIVYAVCKSKIPVQQLQFQTIYLAYKKLHHSDPDIQNCDKNTGNLLNYYSKVFLPAMRSFFKSNLSQTVEVGSLKHSPLPVNFHSPIRNITKNISISPLRNGLPSPSGSMEYTFSSSPRSHLHNINQMLRDGLVSKRPSESDNSGFKHAKKISFSKDDDSPGKSTSKISLFR